MRIGIGNDHSAVDMKNEVVAFLQRIADTALALDGNGLTVHGEVEQGDKGKIEIEQKTSVQPIAAPELFADTAINRLVGIIFAEPQKRLVDADIAEQPTHSISQTDGAVGQKRRRTNA